MTFHYIVLFHLNQFLFESTPKLTSCMPADIFSHTLVVRRGKSRKKNLVHISKKSHREKSKIHGKKFKDRIECQKTIKKSKSLVRFL